MHKNNFTLSQELAKALTEKQLQLTVAESCTGGGLAYQLTAVPGSSAWFDRGFVVYSNKAKIELLGVPAAILAGHGAVSEAVALHLVSGCLKNSDADIALSITGIAGPEGGSVDKPVGTVWFGFGNRQGKLQAKRAFLLGDRQQIRHDAIGVALNWLLQNI